MKLTRHTLLLLAILVIGLFLRAYNLSGESLWLDEGISIKLAHAKPILVIIERAFNNHPPLYFIILHYWVKIFGDSPFSARSLSVIFGVLAIGMIYKVGRLLFNKNTALLSAFLLAISLFHIFYCQEIRMYSLVAFLTLVSMYLLVRLFEERTTAVSVGYILCNVCLLYTHYSAALVIIAQNIYVLSLLLYRPKQKHGLTLKRWAKLQGLIFICYLPWLNIGVIRLSRIQDMHFWIPKPSPFSVLNSFVEFSGSNPLLLVFFALLLSLLVSIKWSPHNCRLPIRRGAYLLLLWLFVPIAVPYAVSQFSASLYLTKYIISASPAFYLLIALGIENIRYKYVKIFAITAILVLSLTPLKRYYAETNKLPWREVAADIEKNVKAGDLIVVNDVICTVDAFSYYFKRDDVVKKDFQPKDKTAHITDLDKESMDELWSAAQGYDRVWIILTHTIDRNLMIKNKFFGQYKFLYHKIYSTRAYISNKITNFVEVFLIEKNK